jgi:glycine/D-amino acid oxidase-like deaminating enzyme/nitrite reductase/ring-hydroxylating ferredoxin subunit
LVTINVFWPGLKTDMRSSSLWMDVEVFPDAPSLDKDIQCDVAVVGSGIAGLSTAYEIAGRGRSVIVIDRASICGGMTARTSAHLAPLCDDLMSEMKRLRGSEMAKTFYQSQAAAVDRIEAIQQDEKIACDFRRLDGYLFQGNDMAPDVIDQELDVLREIGAPVARIVGTPFAGTDKRHGLRYPGQATFHPLKYLSGVALACARRGVRFFANSPVLDVHEENGGVTLRTERAVIRAGHAVVATNASIVDRVSLHTKTAPYRTYVVVFSLPRGALPDALYWDTEDPYHYVRIQPGEKESDFLLVGGEDHKSGEADDADERFQRLEQWIRPFVPKLGKVTHRWSGQVLDTVDYTGFIGRHPGTRFTYVAAGDSGQGLTHGAMGAMLNAGLIVDGQSPWAACYAPDRVPLKAAKNFIMENATAIKNLAEYVGPGEIGSVDELKPGQGAILRQGMKKIAAYRDDQGTLSLRSAACTHVGCHLHFNSFERCWDCPCHGSIFDTDGQPLNAPAITPLGTIK